jgi:superfamily II DNA helicase RecQ
LLISLIEDQVRALLALGIPASSLASASAGGKKGGGGGSSAVGAVNTAIYRHMHEAVRRARGGGTGAAASVLKLLYVTPENITVNTGLQSVLRDLAECGLLARFVIDEAHCVSQWGHDFRPAYVALKMLKRSFPATPIVALTATASPSVRADVTKVLALKAPFVSQVSVLLSTVTCYANRAHNLTRSP